MSPTFFCFGILWILSHQTTEVLMLTKSVFFQYYKKKFQIRAFATEHNNGDPEPLATSDCKLLKLNVTTIIRKNVLQWRLQTGILCKRHKTFIITLISFDIVTVTGKDARKAIHESFFLPQYDIILMQYFNMLLRQHHHYSLPMME